MTRTELAEAIRTRARLEGRFKLRSGLSATEYFDKYRFEGDPALLRAIADALVPLVPASTEMLAGLELGGVPLATALSLYTGLPVVFVRKVAKDYGTRRIAEGGDVAGRRLLIVEDVVTTGGQVVTSCWDLRALGAIVEHAVCVIDRESGGRQKLHDAGLQLHELFAMSEVESLTAAQRPEL
jgi:orotate phosphoribosyltransferase